MQLENLDAVEILSFGAIGLGFLLAFLTYTLIAIEQRKNPTRQPILDLLRRFMGFSVVLLLIGAAASYLNQAKVIVRLNEELTKKNTEYGRLLTDLGEMDQKLDTSKSELIDKQAKITILDSAVDTQREEINDLNELQSELTDSRANQGALNRKIVELKGDVKRLSSREVKKVFRGVCKAKYFNCTSNRAANSQATPWRDMTPYEAKICSLACE